MAIPVSSSAAGTRTSRLHSAAAATHQERLNPGWSRAEQAVRSRPGGDPSVNRRTRASLAGPSTTATATLSTAAVAVHLEVLPSGSGTMNTAVQFSTGRWPG